MVPRFKCCLCGKWIKGYYNNAAPIKKGKCCDNCNINKVLPERFRRLK